MIGTTLGADKNLPKRVDNRFNAGFVLDIVKIVPHLDR